MLVFPVMLSTRVARNMENSHTSAWRGIEKTQSLFWSSTGRGKNWESPAAARQTLPVLCVLVSGDGERGSGHLSFHK